MIRCLIVDDDSLMIHILESLLLELDFIEIVAKVNSAKEAINVMHNENIDLIFLDVEMPEINGIEFLKMFQRMEAKVIIISSHVKYAVDAFDQYVVDYLLKPVDKARLIKAINRATKALNESSNETNFFVKLNTGYQSIPFGDVYYIESLGDYITIVLKGKKYTIHSTLKKLEQKLPQHDFFRIHNSYIVRLDKIEKYEDGYVTVDGKVIPVSRSQKATLLSRLNLF